MPRYHEPSRVEPTQQQPTTHARTFDSPTQPTTTQQPTTNHKQPHKLYEKRHLFVIADGQDILTENLEFSYIEINDRLSKFVTEKTWKSQAAQRLNLN